MLNPLLTQTLSDPVKQQMTLMHTQITARLQQKTAKENGNQ
jgi:hypothetical protein